MKGIARRAAGRLSKALGWILAAAAAPMSACATTPSALPQPRVAYEMHSARINQIRPTPDFERLVSVSQDKTVKVWRLADLQLLRTIHAPSEPGEEGALRAVAVTRDGKEAIVGGWTGIAWHGRGQLYRFDLATGRLLQTLRGLPDIVEALALSRDGSRLAVGFGGTAGLQILEWPAGRRVAEDAEYAERVTFADFSIDGTLATTSQDGCLRLYREGRLTFRAQYPITDRPGAACRGSELGGVRFSPDGRQLAFGLQDRPEMVVMDLDSRNLRRFTIEDPRQRSLCCPNWSTDGRTLFLHGVHEGDGATPLYATDLAGGLQVLRIGRQRFTNVLPMPNGDLVFSTSAPSLGRTKSDGTQVAEQLPPNGDFRFPWPGFRVSEDGSSVVLSMRADGGDSRRFSFTDEPYQAYRAATDADVRNTMPPSRSSRVQVDAVLDEYGYKRPVLIGGRLLQLKPFQSVRSWAGDDRRRALAVGTQWSVLRADDSAHIVWERDLPAPAHQVQISGDGRWIVAAIGDGSIRWFRFDDGAEILGLFPHVNGADWVAWRSDGYYASSPKGDALVGWLLNRSDDQTPDFLRAVQFERELYRPQQLMAALADPRAASSAQALAATLRELAPPRVTIESVTAAADPGGIDIRFSVQATGRPLEEIGVYVDGLPVLPAAGRAVAASESQHLSRTVRAAVAGVAAVRVEAQSRRALGIDESAPAAIVPVSRRPGALWVLTASAQRFERAELPSLPFTHNDAQALAAVLADPRHGGFTRIEPPLVIGGSQGAATKDDLLAGLRRLEAMQPDDTLVLYLASHGIANASEYYFVPEDAEPADVGKVLDTPRATLGPGSVPSLVSGTELAEALKRLPGRRIVILDTCHAGAAEGSSNPYALLKRSAAAQVAVMSAAQGNEKSYHAPRDPHGAFTLALVEVLRTFAGKALTLRDAFDRTLPRVEALLTELRSMESSPERRSRMRQTPVLTAPEILESSPLILNGPP